MEVFGIGPLELLVILVILLIVVGPRRLPEMAVELAHMFRTVRKFGTQISQELSETMTDLEKEYEDMKGDWKDVGQGLSETTKPVSTGLEDAARDATKALEEKPEPSERPSAS
jgi:sec-independent protein translocase protein TatB